MTKKQPSYSNTGNRHHPEKLGFNLDETAQVIGASKPTVIRMIKDGTLKHTRYGSRVFISRDSINAFLAGEH